MAKNIVLLSDGTSNSSAKLFKTNVYRLYEALDRSDPNAQVAYYDDGIGTSSFRPLAVLGGVFGFGLKRNVLDLYRFLCRNYEEGDRIFCFGFSRGAFTVRVLAGLIAREGVVRCGGDEAWLAKEAKWAYRDFRQQFKVAFGLVRGLRRLRDRVLRSIRKPAPREAVDSIQFVGVWDTVAAYGGPIEEMTRAIDHFVWPLSMPDRVMSSKIRRACHAIALDDERNSFHPLLWDEHSVSDHDDALHPIEDDWSPPAGVAPIDRQRLSQVWFTGMHSDVGGGYPQDGLAFKTLRWMMERAQVYGLAIDPVKQREIFALADDFDKVNDSRKGVGAYYRYKPRRLSDLLAADTAKPRFLKDAKRMLGAVTGRRTAAVDKAPPPPMIHQSVIDRIGGRIDGYAPIVLPPSYRVVTYGGDVVTPAPHGSAWVQWQEKVWNWVWARRVVYFLALFTTLFLVALPLINRWWQGHGADGWGRFLIPVIDLGAAVLPDLTAPWLNAFRAAPGRFGVAAVLVMIWLYIGGRLEGRIENLMRMAWASNGPPRRNPQHGVLYRVRTSQWYRGSFYALTHWVLPVVFALTFYAAAVLATAVPVACFGFGASRWGVCDDLRRMAQVSGEKAVAATMAQEDATKDVTGEPAATTSDGGTAPVKTVAVVPSAPAQRGEQ